MEPDQTNSGFSNSLIIFLWLLIPLVILLGDFFSREDGSSPAPNPVIPKVAATTVPQPAPQTLSEVEIADQLVALFSNTANLERMILIPAGPFVLGPHGENEIPQTQFLPDFYIDQFEVTVAEYAIFVNALNQLDWHCYGSNCPQMHHTLKKAMGGLAFADQRFVAKAGYERRPITAIDWQFANLYCLWAGKRLSSNAEWEKAARGDEGIRYPWGNQWRPSWAAEVMLIDAAMFPIPIGSRPNDTSPYGVSDMLGNATEWVADSPLTDIPLPDTAHIRRGVTAVDQETGLTAYNQGWSVTVGFRCALTP